MVNFGAVDASGIGNTILNSLFYVFVGLLVVAMIGGLVWLILRELRFKDFVIIRSEDKNGNQQIRFDRGAVFKSKKTGNTFYQLKFDKKALISVATINYAYSKKGKKIVELYDMNNGNYCSLQPQIKANQDGVGVQYEVTKTDVDWAKEQYISYQKAFTSNSKLWQILPYLGITLMFLGLVIIGIYLIKAYPGMIAGVQAATANLAEAARANAGVIN